jgi:hypothetical protein
MHVNEGDLIENPNLSRHQKWALNKPLKGKSLGDLKGTKKLIFEVA